MAITKTSRVERVLIVLNEDGSLKGAHQEQEEMLAEDGTILSQRQLLPEPLTPETLAAALPSQAALAAQVEALLASLASVTADRDAKAGRITELEAQVAAMQGASP